MSMLITTLKRQHEEIVSLFDKLKGTDIASDSSQLILSRAKELLLIHLKTEDEKLYPALMEAAKEDKSLGTLVQGYINEMKEISVVALDFFEKYSNRKMSGMEFARDYGRFIAALQQRIRKEENSLYNEYDKRFK